MEQITTDQLMTKKEQLPLKEERLAKRPFEI